MKASTIKIYVALALFLASQAGHSQPTQEEMDRFPALKEAYQVEKKGNYKGALRLYRHAYTSNIGKFSALAGVIRNLDRLDQALDAEELLKEEIKADAFNLELRLLSADHKAARANFSQALAELTVAEKISVDDHRIYLKRGLIYQQMGKFDLAIKDLSSAIEKSKTSDADTLLRRAQCHFAMNDHVNAEKDIRKSYQLEPFVSETLLTFVKILFAQKKFQESEPLIKQCTEVDPQNVTCWDLRGDVAREMKNPSAISYFDRAVSLTPNDFEIRKKLADSLDYHGKFQEADAQYAQVLKLQPGHEAALRNHVASLMKRKAYGSAANVLATFHRNDPKNLWVSIEYSSLMSLVGRHDASIVVLKETRRAIRSDAADMYYGHALFQAGDFSSAEDAIEDIKDSKLAKDYNLGITLLRRKKWAKAAAHFEKVSPESKSFFRAQINRAIALQEDGKVDRAIEILSASDFPSDMKELIAKHIQFLSEAKSRKPSSVHEQDGPLQAFTEWELPTL